MTLTKTEWPGERVTRVLRAFAKEHIGFFAAYPEVDQDEMVSIGLYAAYLVWDKYDVGLGSWSNYVRRVAFRRWQDKHRELGRRIKRETVATKARDAKSVTDAGAVLAELQDWFDAGDGAGLPGGLGGNTETLVDWVRHVYQRASDVFPDQRPGRGRKTYTPAQNFASAMLMRKRGLSIRGAVSLLEGDADLLDAMGLAEVPSRGFFWRARQFVTDNLILPRGGE